MLLKSCRCGKLIPQSVKMCEECEQRQQSRHMIYNNTRRDKRAAEFYVSKEWRAMRERIIEVYDNGIGIAPEDILPILNNTQKSSDRYMGVAIGNINKRIYLLCGREYGIGIESRRESFTKVQIIVPIIP